MAGEDFETETTNTIYKLSIENSCGTSHTLSSHAFTSLYLWQNAMGLSVKRAEDFLLRGDKNEN